MNISKHLLKQNNYKLSFHTQFFLTKVNFMVDEFCKHKKKKLPVHVNMQGSKFMSTCKTGVNKTSGYKRKNQT